MSGKPTAFYDLSADDYPFTLVLYEIGTKEEVWRQTVTGPGTITVPGFGRPLGARIEFGNGRVFDYEEG